MEQENKNFKVTGAVISLNSETISFKPLLFDCNHFKCKSDEYCKKYDTQHCSKTKFHYQLTGSHLKRLCENVNKLTAEMGNCDV